MPPLLVIVVWSAKLAARNQLAIGACCALAGLAVAALLAIVVLRKVLAWRRGDPAALEKALLEAGFDAPRELPDGSIERILVGDGIGVRFHDAGSGGHTWTGSMREYAPGEVHIEERPADEGWPPPAVPDAFLCGDPDLDHRFRFISQRKAEVLEPLALPEVHDTLMACAMVDVRVQGDEIVLHDPQRLNLARRWGRAVRDDRLATKAAIAAQVRMHQEVAALIAALARAMRSIRRL